MEIKVYLTTLAVTRLLRRYRGLDPFPQEGASSGMQFVLKSSPEDQAEAGTSPEVQP